MRPSLLLRLAWVLTLVFGVSVFIAFYSARDGMDLRTTLIAGFLLAVIVVVAVFRASRKARVQLDEIASTWELVLDEHGLTRRQRSLPELTIAYTDIRNIEERGTKSLVIKRDSPAHAVGISSAVENYEQLKEDLVQCTGIKITAKRGTPTSVWTYLSLIVVGCLAGVSLLVSNRVVAALASFVLAGVMLSAIVYLYRSPSVTKDIKRRFSISFIPVVVFLIRGFFLLFAQKPGS